MSKTLGGFCVAVTLAIVTTSGGNALTVGPWPQEMAKWSAEERAEQRAAGARLRADLAEAVKRGDKQFTIPPGTYRFADSFQL
jgi:hypothetical protein